MYVYRCICRHVPSVYIVESVYAALDPIAKGGRQITSYDRSCLETEYKEIDGQVSDESNKPICQSLDLI